MIIMHGKSKDKYIDNIVKNEEELRVIPMHRYEKSYLESLDEEELFRISQMVKKWLETRGSNI